MPTYVDGGSSREFTPAPEGTHQAVCVDVIDLGKLETAWGLKRKVSVRWQIGELMADGKPFLVQKRYTASLNEKAVLRHDLESWRGKAFTEDELSRFDLDNLIGVNCLVNIVHKKDAKGKTWGNVATVSPLIKGMAKIVPANYTREKDKVKEDENGDPQEDNRDTELEEAPF